MHDSHITDYFIRTLANRNDWMTYRPGEFVSEEGRAINYVYLSKPSADPLAASMNSTKLKVYIQAAIHGNVSRRTMLSSLHLQSSSKC
jgi:hypothetical protein